MFTWNLNHFLRPNFNINISYLNIHTCRFFLFLQYTSLQSSAFLVSFVCIDRYFTIISRPGSFISKLPFGTVKSATIWSTIIISFFIVLNSHLIIFDRKLKPSKQIDCLKYVTGFQIDLVWDRLHLFLYSLIPSSLMIVFNSLLISKTFYLDKNKTLKYNKNKKVSAISKKTGLTISLLFITFSFIIMTLPASLCYGFFFDLFRSTTVLKYILTLTDYLSYLNHSFIFFNCFLTNRIFRIFVIRIFKTVFKF